MEGRSKEEEGEEGKGKGRIKEVWTGQNLIIEWQLNNLMIGWVYNSSTSLCHLWLFKLCVFLSWLFLIWFLIKFKVEVAKC